MKQIISKNPNTEIIAVSKRQVAVLTETSVFYLDLIESKGSVFTFGSKENVAEAFGDIGLSISDFEISWHMSNEQFMSTELTESINTFNTKIIDECLFGNVQSKMAHFPSEAHRVSN